MIRVTPKPLTAEAFAPFGDVIATGSKSPQTINAATAQRYDNLAVLDIRDQGGRANVSIFVGEPRPLPVVIDMVERHPLGSQLFMPLGDYPYLVAVTNATPPFQAADLSVFLVDDGRGVNYRKGLWHLPLCALFQTGKFFVVDRGGAGENCDEFHFPQDQQAVVEIEPPR